MKHPPLKNIYPSEVFTITYYADLEIANKIEKTLTKGKINFDTEKCVNKALEGDYKIIVELTISNARSVNNQIQNLLHG